MIGAVLAKTALQPNVSETTIIPSHHANLHYKTQGILKEEKNTDKKKERICLWRSVHWLLPPLGVGGV